MKDGSLEDLPNIGHNLVRKLEDVGILKSEDLLQKGSRAAFMLIRSSDPGACIDMLYALEGAVRGIRWHGLGDEDKQSLRQFYQSIEKSDPDE
ncbi:MAG: TfoX/Sxy family protein [Bacteroidetes bacterium]|nr:TfoX/Sxy family protein [Bacteroidota bacterium]